jgi:hypothetical protein
MQGVEGECMEADKRLLRNILSSSLCFLKKHLYFYEILIIKVPASGFRALMEGSYVRVFKSVSAIKMVIYHELIME